MDLKELDICILRIYICIFRWNQKYPVAVKESIPLPAEKS